MSDVPSSAISHLQAGRSPVLDAAQIDVLSRYGSESDVAAGEVLFAEGDETYDLIVILDGRSRSSRNTADPASPSSPPTAPTSSWARSASSPVSTST